MKTALAITTALMLWAYPAVAECLNIQIAGQNLAACPGPDGFTLLYDRESGDLVSMLGPGLTIYEMAGGKPEPTPSPSGSVTTNTWTDGARTWGTTREDLGDGHSIVRGKDRLGRQFIYSCVGGHCVRVD